MSTEVFFAVQAGAVVAFRIAIGRKFDLYDRLMKHADKQLGVVCQMSGLLLSLKFQKKRKTCFITNQANS